MKTNIWVVGDIHGCYFELNQLLRNSQIDPNARFWFAGDLVNRGFGSLDTLRKIMTLDDRSVVVLGNHDIHLLALAAGVGFSKPETVLDTILNAPDYNDLINWLRFRPLAHFEHDHLMVHAGVLANWDIPKILSIASEIQDMFRASNWQKKIKEIYNCKDSDQIRSAINVFTKIRLCEYNGQMVSFDRNNRKRYQLNPSIPGKNFFIPWFDVPNRKTHEISIFFGHWSDLGLFIRPNLVCLDTGCIWGGYLTAMRLHDRHLIQIPNVQNIKTLSK